MSNNQRYQDINTFLKIARKTKPLRLANFFNQNNITFFSDFSALQKKLLFLSNYATNAQLLDICEHTVDFCEITNDWNDWYLCAQKIKNNSKNFPGLIFYGIGRYHEELGNMKESFDYHQRGLLKIKNNEKWISMRFPIINLMKLAIENNIDYFSLSSIKNLNNLIVPFIEIASYIKSHLDNLKWFSLNCQGVGISLFRKNPYRAKYYLFIAKKFIKKTGNPYYYGCICSDLGGYFLRINKPIKAIHYFNIAIISHLIFCYKWDLSRFFYSLASAYLATKYTAIFSFIPLLIAMYFTKYSSSSQNRYLALSYYGYSRLFYKLHLYKKAHRMIIKADEVYNSFFEGNQLYNDNNIIIYIMFINIYIKLGDKTKANLYLDLLKNNIPTEIPDIISKINKLEKSIHEK